MAMDGSSLITLDVIRSQPKLFLIAGDLIPPETFEALIGCRAGY